MNVNENCTDEIAGQKHDEYLAQISRAFAPFEGERQNSVGLYTNMGYNHLNGEKTANDYIGAELRANEPINTFSRPNGEIVKSYGANKSIGVIYSWVEVPKGVIWWHLEDGTFVKHREGLFDKDLIDSSLATKKRLEQNVIDKNVQERISQNDNAFYAIGKTGIPNFFSGITSAIQKVIIGVVIVVIVAAIFKFA